jgi:iron complex transport system substrate-binding protein
MTLRLVLLFLLAFVALHAEPRRIVSTSPSITETLFALGLGDRVVGVSKYCQYPAEAMKLPKVGPFLRPDAEVIARLRPDLVIVHKLPNDLRQRLDQLGLATLQVERGTLPKVYETIREVGKAAGVPERAEALIQQLQTRLAAVRRKSEGRPKPKVLFIVAKRPGTLSDLVAVADDSYLNDVIEIAGGVNVLGGKSMPAYPRISVETVVRMDPDFLIDTATPMEGLNDKKVLAASLATWQQQAGLTAVKRGNVHAFGSEASVLPGPRVAEFAENLFAILHGGAEKR